VFVFDETLLSFLFMSCQQYPEYFIPTYLFISLHYTRLSHINAFTLFTFIALDDGDRKNAVLLLLQRGTRSNFEDMKQTKNCEIGRIIILSSFIHKNVSYVIRRVNEIQHSFSCKI
jgi:hypothetical protein